MTLVFIIPELFFLLLISSLIVSVLLWKYLIIFVAVAIAIYYAIGMIFFYGSSGLFLILFLFNVPGFSVIGMYCFIYYGFFVKRTKIAIIEYPDTIVYRK